MNFVLDSLESHINGRAGKLYLGGEIKEIEMILSFE